MSDPPTNVTDIKTVERERSSTKIIWSNLKFDICKPKYQFNLLFKNNSTNLFNTTTNNPFYNCDSRCAKATSLDIWMTVNGLDGNITVFPLLEIKEGEFLQKSFVLRLFYLKRLLKFCMLPKSVRLIN